METRMRRELISLVLCVPLLAVVAPALAQGPPPATVVLDAARQETVERYRQVTGQVRAQRRSLIAAQEEGFVVAVEYDAGDRVDAGAMIARLDDALAKIEVRSREAELEALRAVVSQREAEYEVATLDLERVEELRSRGSASASEYDNARTTQAAAGARLDEARAEVERGAAALDDARERLSDMVIRAPFAGAVVSKRAEVGQWLGRGDAVAEIVETDRLEAWLDVPERFAGRISDTSAMVRVRVDAVGLDERFRIERIVSDVDELSRLFSIRIPLNDASGALKPGMTAVGEVPTGEDTEALTVHKDAILRDDAGTFVYVAREGENGLIAAPARVRISFATGDRVAIDSVSVRAGDRVIVEGNERVYPTQPIAPKDEVAPDPVAGAEGEG